MFWFYIWYNIERWKSKSLFLICLIEVIDNCSVFLLSLITIHQDERDNSTNSSDFTMCYVYTFVYTFDTWPSNKIEYRGKQSVGSHVYILYSFFLLLSSCLNIVKMFTFRCFLRIRTWQLSIFAQHFFYMGSKLQLTLQPLFVIEAIS